MPQLTGPVVFGPVANGTGYEVARQFAETHWEQPRKIAKWSENRFKLVDGNNWYFVRIGKDQFGGVAGWNVHREIE